MFELKDIDTDSIITGRSVKVLIYYKNINKAIRKFNELIIGYNVKKVTRGLNIYYAEVELNGLIIEISLCKANDSARGNKTNYALVDRELFYADNGYEIFECVIVPSVNRYNVKSEYLDMEVSRIHKY